MVGALGRSRTCNRSVRSRVLYPVELRAQLRNYRHVSSKGQGEVAVFTKISTNSLSPIILDPLIKIVDPLWLFFIAS